LLFSTTFVWNISHSKKNWARYDHVYMYMYIGLQVKYPLFLSDFDTNWIFRTEFRTLVKSHEIRPVGAQMLHENRKADMTKLRFAFRSFVKRLTSTYLHLWMNKINDKWQSKQLRNILSEVSNPVRFNLLKPTGYVMHQ
jgi:hypothetical protein